jgi:hypothetical protein
MSALPRDEDTTAEAEALARMRLADASSRSFDHDFDLPPAELVEVRCECGQLNCSDEIEMSLQEYEAVRIHPTRFLIKEGHQVADVVRVVGYGAGYVVGEKYERDVFSVRAVL